MAGILARGFENATSTLEVNQGAQPICGRPSIRQIIWAQERRAGWFDAFWTALLTYLFKHLERFS